MKPRLALMNWRPKSSPEGLESDVRDPPSTRKDASETKFSIDSLPQRENTGGPPKTFQDILPPQLITTSTLSEAGYMGYRKSKFRSTRASTLPAPQTQSLLSIKGVAPTVVGQPTAPRKRKYPSPSPTRRSTLKVMKGVMQTIKRSMSFHDLKKKNRPPIPSSSAFSTSNSRSFGTGSGRHSFRIQEGGYLNLPDGEDAVGDR